MEPWRKWKDDASILVCGLWSGRGGSHPEAVKVRCQNCGNECSAWRHTVQMRDENSDTYIVCIACAERMAKKHGMFVQDFLGPKGSER